MKITYPAISNLTYNFKLTITVLHQQINQQQHTEVITKTIHIPEKQVRIYPLEGGKIYKIQVSLNSNGIEYTKTIFTYVSKQVQEENAEEYEEII